VSWPGNEASITIRVHPEFLAKTQVAGDVGSLQPIVIVNIPQFLSEGMLEDLTLCPVHSLLCYLNITRTKV
jgi:hypothetical protein